MVALHRLRRRKGTKKEKKRKDHHWKSTSIAASDDFSNDRLEEEGFTHWRKEELRK